MSGVGEIVGYAAKKNCSKFSNYRHIKNNSPPSSNGDKEVSPSCVKIYLNKFSQDERISIKKKFFRKTVLRISTENYPRYTTVWIMNIAASNFIEGRIPQDHPRNTKLCTDGSRKLVGMIQDKFVKDIYVYHIHRSFLAITDDTRLFISSGKLVHIARTMRC